MGVIVIAHTIEIEMDRFGSIFVPAATINLKIGQLCPVRTNSCWNGARSSDLLQEFGIHDKSLKSLAKLFSGAARTSTVGTVEYVRSWLERRSAHGSCSFEQYYN